MTANDDNEARLQALEELVAHQEQIIQELSTALYETRNAVDRLQTLSRQQQVRLESIAAQTGGETAPADDPPPHY